jgi:hypothetical protein
VTGTGSGAGAATADSGREGNAENYETSRWHWYSAGCFHLHGLPVLLGSSIIERAAASSFPNATPRRIAENRTRITIFEHQCRLEKVISLYFVTTKQYKEGCQLTGYIHYGYSYILVIKEYCNCPPPGRGAVARGFPPRARRIACMARDITSTRLRNPVPERSGLPTATPNKQGKMRHLDLLMLR